MQIGSLLLASTATLLASGIARAQYAEGFDSQASADVTINLEADTSADFVDYSNMTIGATTFSIPEAPRRIPGSAPTRGIVCRANITLSQFAAVNILAGANPITFSGRHRLSFDAYMAVSDPFPTSGSTEQLLWGLGTDNAGVLEARKNRTMQTMGVWGWLAGENGYGTEDAAIFQDGTELADLGDQQPGEGVPFTEAFNKPIDTTATNAPANQWVRVDIDVDVNGDVRVYYNGIEFFNQAGLSPSGFAMIGYEDPFNSLNTNPDELWGLFDNFRVSLGDPNCPIPGSSTIQGTATGGEILNGSAIPAAGSPMTARLRGGPASAGALLAMGFPAPATIPIPLGSCTLNVEVVIPTLASILTFTDPLGNSEFSVNVPAGGFFCGRSFGFQYYWIDSTPCGVAHTEGLAFTIGG